MLNFIRSVPDLVFSLVRSKVGYELYEETANFAV